MSVAEEIQVERLVATNDALNERLARIEQKLETLVECVLSPSAPKSVAEKGLHVRVRNWEATAKRARMGRAAKRHGMTLQQWIETHGEVEKLPA